MTEPGWNFADLWEVVATALPSSPAVIQGSRRLRWDELDRRANGLAAALLDLGLGRQEKVAQYLFNGPEYLESTFALFKVGLVPVNTNYRYRGPELVYLWDNADAVAVIFHATFTERIEDLRSRLPLVRVWLWVDDGSGPCPPWALAYDALARPTDKTTRADWGRSPDDLLLLYTGGTTGLPKGVMWRQGDVFLFLNGLTYRSYPPEAGLEAVADRLRAEGPGLVHLAPSPLMHATGGWSSYNAFSCGGTVVLLEDRHFRAEEMLEVIQRERVNTINMVGEAFAGPLAEALRAHPGHWDLSSLQRLSSTGAALSPATKQTLLEHLPPTVVFTEGLSSSEAVAMGGAQITLDGVQATGRFKLAAGVRVVTEEGRDVVPGSGEIGLVALDRLLPLGYYKDPEKTASTFRFIDGRRYVVPGDYATIEADGTLAFVGRGNETINTGGEKVYAQEVESVLLRHPAVRDAAVVGIPDARFGQAVAAVVQRRAGSDLTREQIVDYVKAHLAGYKAPRQVHFVEAVARHASGKADYPTLRRLVQDQPPAAT